MANISTPQQPENFFCKISVTDTDNWFHGIISDINHQKNIVQVFLHISHIKNNFNVGDPVIIKSLKQSNEMLFKGIVSKKVTTIHKQALVVKIDETRNYANKRMHEHFNLSCAATIKAAASESIPAMLGDISLGGVLIHSEGSFEKDDIIRIEVLANYKKPICFDGKIVRKVQNGSRYSYGIQIVSIDKENYEILKEIIQYLIMQRKQVAHDLKVFKRFKYTVYTFSFLVIFYIVLFVIGIEAR